MDIEPFIGPLPRPYCEVPMIEPTMGKIVGITRSGLLIHEHDSKRWVSGYTLAGYGVENLSEEEKACINT